MRKLRRPLPTPRNRGSHGRVTLGERFVSAVLGVVFGALVGLALVWLLGVYSHRMGATRGVEGLKELVGSTALVFGVLGFALGSHAGTWLGEFINALFAAEGAYDRNPPTTHLPTWLVVAVLIVVVAAVLVFAA